ncbi:DUF86 domain-containing protein [Candidatus Uhrbacteria bacterium]|nr:DUF86 domain-containing protein [Candidatus Uhrbacteria bacterium]
MKDDRLYLIHMGECVERIGKYTASGKEEFFADAKTQDAVLRNLQILGESAKHVSVKLRSAHTEIDWRGIIGFRNVLVHDYLGVKLDRVWEVVERFLPGLGRKIEAILRELGDSPSK